MGKVLCDRTKFFLGEKQCSASLKYIAEGRQVLIGI